MNELIYYVLVNDSSVGSSYSLLGAIRIVKEIEQDMKKYPTTMRPEIHIKSLNTVTNDWCEVKYNKLKGVDKIEITES